MSKRHSRSVLPIILMMAGALNGLVVCGQTASTGRGVRIAPGSGAPSLPTGAYYALVIGNQNYKNLPKLKTPIQDANEIAKLLHERYRFQTKVLVDANRDQILTVLTDYRRTLPEDSSLLIYYAGHGVHDPDTDEAYWLPIDARSDNNANWISADDITSDVKAIRSLHVLIISDSCYSGYIAASRSVNVGINPAERHAFLAKMLASKSRNLMSSGGDEPVTDSGAPGHSAFAAAILDSLRRIDDNDFTAADLFQEYVQPAVGGRSAQLPQYSAIRNSGHQYGDFVFSKQPSKGDQAKGDQDKGDQAHSSPGVQRQPTRKSPGILSADEAKVLIVQHDFFHAQWNQGGGTTPHQYKVGASSGFLTVVDPATGLMWERGGSGQTRGYKEAQAYVESLNAAKSGGFNDWRLPTLEEAMSLMTSPEHGQGGQVLIGDSTRNVIYHIDKSFEIGRAFFIWTADQETPTRGWVVYFGEGDCHPEDLRLNAYVRAVRTNR